MFLDRKSLRNAINEEINRNNQTISHIGKHNVAIIAPIIAVIGLFGIQTLPNYFSEWILSSNLLIAFLFIGGYLNLAIIYKKNSSREKKSNKNSGDNQISEEERNIRNFLCYDSSVYCIESVSCALALIFLINLIIVVLVSGNIANGNFSSLGDNINFILSIPVNFWFLIQALLFFITVWFFTTKPKIIRESLRSFLIIIPYFALPIEFDKFKPPFFSGLAFFGSAIFFSLSILITIISYRIQMTNYLILLILGVQIVLFYLLNTIISEILIKRECDNKVYQLRVALGLIDDDDFLGQMDANKKAEEIYHMTKVLIPIKRRGLILRSNYMLIPNVSYWDKKYADLLLKYIKSVF